MQITRHVGKITNTGIRIVVIYRKLPDDPTSCLVVESDRLPDFYHDNLMTILNSKEGQAAREFYEVLHRRKFGDGTNCLQTLHTKGYMKKMRVADVTLYPAPNYPLTLLAANNEMDGTSLTENGVDEKATSSASRLPVPGDEVSSLIKQAELLEEDAVRLREQAYTLNPSLRPKKGRPAMTAEDKAQAKAERKARRTLESLEKAEADKVANLEKAIAEKISRDEIRANQ